jgi:hypothetical protein
MSKNRGYYFLANNTVLDLSIAFLNSFRTSNPDAQLCFIPYNDDHSEILALRDIYKFEVFGDSDLLRHYDCVSTRFHGNVDGSYRKLAMWDGIYEEFAYIDIDTIVLANADFAFRFLAEFPCLTSHSNIPQIRQFVWKDSIYETGRLSGEQISFSANTGFIVSEKGLIDRERIFKEVDNAVALKDHMALACQEQPFLNYLIVTSGKPFTSLHTLYYEHEIQDRIMLEKWAGVRDSIALNGHLYPTTKPTFLVHWAGEWQPDKFDFMCYKVLKRLRLMSEDRIPKLRILMPYKRLWKHYRYMRGMGTGATRGPAVSDA